jgi:putative ABC transport system ATP-binding protein
MLIALKAVTRSYDSGEGHLFALRNVSLTLPEGEFIAVVGSSGSGKSTLLNLVSGIDRPSQGEVWVANERIDLWSEDQLAKWRRRTLGVVFQFFQLLPTLTALENVLLPMSLAGSSDESRARALLTEVGLAHRMGHLPTMLSGGEQQRVAIARALANRPPLLIADEPTGNLDERTGTDIMSILRSLPAQGTSVIMVTHDARLAAQADRVVQMANGEVVRVLRRKQNGFDDTARFHAVPNT